MLGELIKCVVTPRPTGRCTPTSGTAGSAFTRREVPIGVIFSSRISQPGGGGGRRMIECQLACSPLSQIDMVERAQRTDGSAVVEHETDCCHEARQGRFRRTVARLP